MTRRASTKGMAEVDRSYLASPPPLFDEAADPSTDLCQRCFHPRSDHKPETEKRHAHFRTVAGDEKPRLFRTTNRDGFCHSCLCSCLYFVEDGEVLVSSFSREWIKANKLELLLK
jgi:hypothetical protein